MSDRQRKLLDINEAAWARVNKGESMAASARQRTQELKAAAKDMKGGK
jgi:hypothetical protein